ncbi:unnamed protein product [Psylliodes chrysocephalus]|uniref:Ig-like domain-containing protein n=1 Tax=Psylliodes chrysocephalus TaxID=3402493 RepID=A0A9P0D0Z4_9CUCU|nr:unnamed protein product [Psylliodes chrysocephala]
MEVLFDLKKLRAAENMHARRDGYQQQQKYSEWRQLWYPSFEDFSRAEAMTGAENNTITNVTVQLGATAYLHCHVRSTGDRTLAGAEQVSWVRRRDWHILSSGVFTYTNDERFQILHAEGSDDWTLQIKYVQKRDNGTYECQVSTGQGLISHFVNLQIVVPEATIQGIRSGEHHVDIGSIIDLVCIIERHGPKNASYRSPIIQNKIIDLCGASIKEQIISNVKKACAYIILADETADISGKEQLSVGLRFIDENTNEIKKELLGFVELEELNVVSIAKAIDDFVTNLDLDPDKCVGLGFDGSSTMSRKEAGV